MTAAAADKRKRVLLVEDDRAVSRMLGIALGSAGFEVTPVTTGGEGLRLLRQSPPDAVVLDLGLPDNLGGAVLDALRTDDLPVHLPYVVMSADDASDIAFKYGPMDFPFLAKPFDPWRLVATLNELLSRTSEKNPKQR